jgi:hypothetical protein
MEVGFLKRMPSAAGAVVGLYTEQDTNTSLKYTGQDTNTLLKVIATHE